MDHHEPFVWHMVKMVVDMPSMLDLSNQGATTLNVYVRSLLGVQIATIPVMYNEGGLFFDIMPLRDKMPSTQGRFDKCRHN